MTGLWLSAQCETQIEEGCEQGCQSTCGGLLDAACTSSCILLTETIEAAFPGSICNNENPTQPNNCNHESTVVYNICKTTGGLEWDCVDKATAYYDACVAGTLKY